MSDKLDEARQNLLILMRCGYDQRCAEVEQAARDFAAAEAEGLYELWYRGLPAPTEYESGREDGHDRLTEALRAGGLAKEEAGDGTERL